MSYIDLIFAQVISLLIRGKSEIDEMDLIVHSSNEINHKQFEWRCHLVNKTLPITLVSKCISKKNVELQSAVCLLM